MLIKEKPCDRHAIERATKNISKKLNPKHFSRSFQEDCILESGATGMTNLHTQYRVIVTLCVDSSKELRHTKHLSYYFLVHGASKFQEPFDSQYHQIDEVIVYKVSCSITTKERKT